jgi:hypothetical protein
VQAIGSSTDRQGVRTALEAVDEEGLSSVQTFQSATFANQYARRVYGYEHGPYRSGTVAVVFEPEDSVTLQRFHASSNADGPWMTSNSKRRSIEQTIIEEDMSVEEARELIRRELSLPDPPEEISTYEVPAGSRIRTGEIAENFGGEEGTIQYEILHPRVSEDWATTQSISNWVDDLKTG